jgi:DNA-binding LytR/AlgR family response regulator
MTMKDIESKLPEDAFLRISRSYIVKFQEIVALEGNEIKLKEGHRLQIGRTFKDEVRKRIEGITM